MADIFREFDTRSRQFVPKLIEPDTHAALDYLTISAFLLAAGATWNSNRRASIAAVINGFFVLGYSMFTDYSGSVRKKISFETHGKLDVVQASMALLMPTLLGFDGTKSATFFHGQALDEMLVVLLTDWTRRGTKKARLPRVA